MSGFCACRPLSLRPLLWRPPVAMAARCALPALARSPRYYSRARPSPGEPPERIVVPLRSVDELERKLLHRFADRSLLVQAMLHKSCIDQEVLLERPGGGTEDVSILGCNDRLEWLGDKVFGLRAASHLMAANPELNEGPLTVLLTAVVSRKRSNKLAVELDLSQHLVCSSHLPPPPPGRLPSRYGNFWEALFGALYEDGGDAAVGPLWNEKVAPLLERCMINDVDRNWKGTLLELLVKHNLHLNVSGQVRIEDLPLEPSLEATARRSGHSMYAQGIFVHNALVAVGSGTSKRVASQAAARRLLERLHAAPGVPALLDEFRAQGSKGLPCL